MSERSQENNDCASSNHEEFTGNVLFSMSPQAAPAGPSTPLIRKSRKISRRSFRNATFIIPSTRERVRRHFTLRNSANFDGPLDTDQTASLLPFHRHISTGNFTRAFECTKASAKDLWKWLQTRQGRGVIKCSIAYVIACMATFVPLLYNFLGRGDGKHLVATIVVYFHPARSGGSMVEAVMLGTIAFLYAAFISVASMAVSVLCETQFELIELGYTLVLIIFVGGGLGLVGWIKQRMGSPLVGVACSLASLAIITVITKENAVQTGIFSDDKITQVMKMLIMAMIITTIVNLVFWPISARQDLRQSMIDTTFAISALLTTITTSFLQGSDDELKSSAFRAATKRYTSEFTALSKNLREAKAEHYFLGTEDQYRVERKIVNCMERLAQDIGGLRSAATTQFTLLQETFPNGNTGIMSPKKPHGMASYGTITGTTRMKLERFNSLTAIEEAAEEDSGREESSSRPSFERTGTMDSDATDLMAIRTPSDIFARFLRHLGPSMKSLVFTMQQILDELPFGPGPEFKIVINENFLLSLSDALDMYRKAREEALAQLYRAKDPEREKSVEADFEEVAASCGHYSFCLQDFAEGIQKYLEVLEELKEELQGPQKRSWNWVKFWSWKTEERDAESDLAQNSNDIFYTRKIKKANLAIPKVRRIPKRSLSRRLYQAAAFLEREDIRYAIKVGVGAALWAMFAFIPATRPFYQFWRGEWGLLSYMLVCSITTGTSNTTAMARTSGTLIGAGIAIIIWVMCQGNPYALGFCGWLVCLGGFYIIVVEGRGPFGRFILLTYNLSALYAYSLSIRQGEDDDDEGGVNPIITEIALHRVASVACGCLWGLFIVRVIWPYSARSHFKEGLSTLWLRMGLIWKRDPLSAILSSDIHASYMNLTDEFALQAQLKHLDSLRASAKGEFELRGPFKSAPFARIMESTRRMLEAFHSMNAVIAQNLVASPGEIALLRFTVEERKELCGRICHLFQVMASSLMLEYPVAVNDAMPSMRSPRDRLLSRIYKFRSCEVGVGAIKDKSEEDRNAEGVREGGCEREEWMAVAKDEDYALLYAYALVTGQLAEEIEKVEKEIESLFGVLDESRW
ncbi:hypothetical protein VE01_09283 [Pseudogymnoascus verrucosus]|uniref:Integral membrane bound transporter domain-containing protein n=1 Tax=Pseudogymnoascus verrucosus TaxID=342668 RepID=A0A1B8G9E6_9PEZI|nr:uncharacterized protein VE01_09283 [Pseudogymnoascus verrucosus]OBT92431.1 hypothetical protein VE01_09283 [Pseudogymnoascus verrucosus]